MLRFSTKILAALLSWIVASLLFLHAPGLIASEADHAVHYVYKDEFRRDTPQGSYLGFIAACERRDFATAAQYLDLRFLPPSKRDEEAEEYARKLKFVLDRTVITDDLHLSDVPGGIKDDGLPQTRDRIGTIISSKGSQVSITMDRIWEKQIQVWKFSQSTLQEVPQLYQQYSHDQLSEYLPKFMLKYDFLNLQLWQWFFLILFLPLGYFLAKIIVLASINFLPKILKRYDSLRDLEVYRQLSSPFVFLLCTLIYLCLLIPLNLTIIARQTLQMILITLMFIALTWLSLRLIDLLSAKFQKTLRQKGLYSANSVIPLGRRFAKVFLFIVTVLALLQLYHVNITALLAGLGVGGVAVALAAQKSLENLFSGIALITDQPVRVGDFCRYENQMGNVEDIGLRSTRIRTIDRTVVTIPNREFSQMKLENLSKRDRMTIQSTLKLRYDTTADQLRYILMELRKLLYSHPKVAQDDRVRVRFLGFHDYAMNVDFFAHIKTNKWYEFLAIQEDIYLRVLDIVKSSGSNFSLPARTVYSETGTGIDAAESSRREAAVHQMREENQLPFPNFSQEDIVALQNTLDYPPRGSTHNRPRSG